MTPDPKPLKGLGNVCLAALGAIVSAARQIDCAPSGKVRSLFVRRPAKKPDRLLVSLRAPLSDVVISDNENQVL